MLLVGVDFLSGFSDSLVLRALVHFAFCASAATGKELDNTNTAIPIHRVAWGFILIVFWLHDLALVHPRWFASVAWRT